MNYELLGLVGFLLFAVSIVFGFRDFSNRLNSHYETHVELDKRLNALAHNHCNLRDQCLDRFFKLESEKNTSSKSKRVSGKNSRIQKKVINKVKRQLKELS